MSGYNIRCQVCCCVSVWVARFCSGRHHCLLIMVVTTELILQTWEAEVCRPGYFQRESQTRFSTCSQVNCSRPFYFKSWINLSGDEALLCSGAERSCLWFLRDDKTLQQSVTPGENTLVTAAVNRGGLHAQTQVAATLSASIAASEGCLVLRWTLNLQQQRRPAARWRARTRQHVEGFQEKGLH